MSNISCLREGIDEPMEEYYRRFKASISISELEKFNTTTHMKLNQLYEYVDNKDRTNRFQAISLIMSTDLDQY